MKYYRIFNHVRRDSAEETFNTFLKEVDDKGHRVLYSKVYFNDMTMDAIYLVTDQKRYEEKAL